MQRLVMSKRWNAGLTPFQTVPMSSKKCQLFCIKQPFTYTIAGMTGSGKTAWVQSLLQQASEAIYLPPQRTIWCYSHRQSVYREMLVAMPHIELSKEFLWLRSRLPILMGTNINWMCLMIRRLTSVKTSILSLQNGACRSVSPTNRGSHDYLHTHKGSRRMLRPLIQESSVSVLFPRYKGNLT